jgi:predicted RNase H-like nuclease (RuvC/YqgF family)
MLSIATCPVQDEDADAVAATVLVGAPLAAAVDEVDEEDEEELDLCEEPPHPAATRATARARTMRLTARRMTEADGSDIRTPSPWPKPLRSTYFSAHT